jgi:hypothetical protein
VSSKGSRRGARPAFHLGAAILIAVAVVACTVAELPSPAASPTAAEASVATPTAGTPEPTGSIVDATPSRNPAGATPTETAPTDIDEEPADTPTPPLPKGTLPSLAAAPSSPWTAINWTALPGGHYPAVPTEEGAGDPNATLVGWHGGYIEFLWDPGARTLTPWVSANGLTWRSGPRMDLSSFAGEFKYLDDEASVTPEPGESPYPSGEADQIRYGCSFVEVQFEEGPSTLLLRGYLHCGDACGHPITMNDDSFWVSSDGLVWSPVDIKKALGGAEPDRISGGSSGFAAYAGSHLWISQNGREWHTGVFPAGANRSEPVAMADGFVIGDAVVLVKGHNDLSAPGYCTQDGADLAKYRAEFWLSPDGSNWTATHDGIIGYGVSVEMTRLNDHLVIAYESDGSHEYQLVSRDGRAWTQLSKPLIDTYSLICGRDQGFIVDDQGDSGTVLQTFDSNLLLQWAVGPTGILATLDGERFWIGVPTSA